MNGSTTDTDPPKTGRRPGWRALLWLLALAALTAAGFWSWHNRDRVLSRLPALTGEQAPEGPSLDARLSALESAVEALRQEQRQQSRRQMDNSAALGVVREELFGVRDRAALLEQTIEQATARTLRAEHLFRLDEVELLLSLGQQRLALADDLASAIQAYSLAAQSLSRMSEPRYVTLRQTLDQELAALRALPPDPRAKAAGELDALEAALATLPIRAHELANEADRSRLSRLLGQLVQVRPVGDELALRAEDRSAGLTAVQLQLAMARLALSRRDRDAFVHALGRIDAWLKRLYFESPERIALQERLLLLADLPLAIDVPVLGSTLEQLRQHRDGALTSSAPADDAAPPQ